MAGYTLASLHIVMTLTWGFEALKQLIRITTRIPGERLASCDCAFSVIVWGEGGADVTSLLTVVLAVASEK